MNRRQEGALASLELPSDSNSNLPYIPSEQAAIQSLYSSLAAMGVSRYETVTAWIGLKSKPGMIICAGAPSLADQFSITLARKMIGADGDRLLILQGHPWWVPAGVNQAQLIAMQGRMNSIRLRTFLVNAALSRESGHAYFVLLQGISRAELHTYFTQIPIQLKALDGVLDLPWDLAEKPTVIRKNVWLIATERQPLGLIDQPDILGFSTILDLVCQQAATADKRVSPNGADSSLQGALIRFRTTDPLAARSLIPAARRGDALRVVGEVLTLLERHRVGAESGLIKDAYLYLGHAWDPEGLGLFSQRGKDNIRYAAEFWLTQSFIPRIANVVKRLELLSDQILRFFADHYPLAEAAWRTQLESAA